MGETTKMMFAFLLLFLITLGLQASGSFQDEVSRHHHHHGQSKEWNTLILTQSWPPAVCIYVENEEKKCEISSNISVWAIHGLWPTESGTEGPNFCNNSWKFDLSKVQVLRPRLDYNWPSIEQGEKPQDSWTHEWDKHGTCGASLPALKDELAYFNVTLGLHDRVNLALYLKQGGVLPSDEVTYKAEDVLMILHKALGVLPTISCVRDKKNGKYYLEQIEVCLTKAFKPTDCASTEVTSVLELDTLHDLLFQSEKFLNGRKSGPSMFRGNIHDCGSGGIYYKPMPAQSLLSRG